MVVASSNELPECDCRSETYRGAVQFQTVFMHRSP